MLPLEMKRRQCNHAAILEVLSMLKTSDLKFGNLEKKSYAKITREPCISTAV